MPTAITTFLEELGALQLAVPTPPVASGPSGVSELAPPASSGPLGGAAATSGTSTSLSVDSDTSDDSGPVIPSSLHKDKGKQPAKSPSKPQSKSLPPKKKQRLGRPSVDLKTRKTTKQAASGVAGGSGPSQSVLPSPPTTTASTSSAPVSGIAASVDSDVLSFASIPSGSDPPFSPIPRTPASPVSSTASTVSLSSTPGSPSGVTPGTEASVPVEIDDDGGSGSDGATSAASVALGGVLSSPVVSQPRRDGCPTRAASTDAGLRSMTAVENEAAPDTLVLGLAALSNTPAATQASVTGSTFTLDPAESAAVVTAASAAVVTSASTHRRVANTHGLDSSGSCGDHPDPSTSLGSARPDSGYGNPVHGAWDSVYGFRLLDLANPLMEPAFTAPGAPEAWCEILNARIPPPIASDRVTECSIAGIQDFADWEDSLHPWQRLRVRLPESPCTFGTDDYMPDKPKTCVGASRTAAVKTWRIDRQMDLNRETITLTRTTLTSMIVTSRPPTTMNAELRQSGRTAGLRTAAVAETSRAEGSTATATAKALTDVVVSMDRVQHAGELTVPPTTVSNVERNGSFGGGESDERKTEEWNSGGSEGLVSSVTQTTWHDYQPGNVIKPLSGERLGWWSAQKFDKRVRMRALGQGAMNDARTRILLDTGANVSVISERFAKQLRLREVRAHGRCMEIQGFTKGTMATAKRALAKVTMGWNQVYEYELWVMDHGAGVDVVLGTDFMIPAGVRLDLFHATARLPDEIEIPLIKTQRMTDTRKEGPHVPDGPTEVLTIPGNESRDYRPMRQPPTNETHELWVRRTKELIPKLWSLDEAVHGDYARELAFLPDLTEAASTTLDHTEPHDRHPFLSVEQQDRVVKVLKSHEQIMISSGNALPPPAYGVVCDIDVQEHPPIKQKARRIPLRHLKQLIMASNAVWIKKCPDDLPMIYQRMIDNALWEFLQPRGGWSAFAERVRTAEAADTTVGGSPTDTVTHSRTRFEADRESSDLPDSIPAVVNDPRGDKFASGEADQSLLVPVFKRRSFVDDICFGGESFDSCLETLDRLLSRFEECLISVSFTKSMFVQPTVDFLSHAVSREGLRADAKKLKAIIELSFPKTKKGVQAFLGALNYYSRFIQGFAVYGAALYQVCEEDFGAGGDLSTAKRSFTALQAKVADAPILRHFDRAKEVHVMLFANDWALSTTLTQKHDGVMHPVRFCGRVLKYNEVNYHPAEKEVLALLLLLKTCYTQLAGHEALQRVTPPSKRTPMVRMDPALLYARLQNDHRGFVLSFDGSAKTPKHGGYGSCAWNLWRLPDWKIEIAASAYRESTTVNQAEYMGMNEGLRAAQAYGVTDLVVVGDSRLAIQQSLGVIACLKESLLTPLSIHRELVARF
ncbi:unnamed protein product [Phytophthora fragariaefolia]|uniref:Unnamed protein product n=1 Tax=Phytophthora fragariaefolia TaxID=1490495 RepID=A0A9W7CTC6_9STRA|nr:unnamed protein product [Phytophthora fragariaefolia]